MKKFTITFVSFAILLVIFSNPLTAKISINQLDFGNVYVESTWIDTVSVFSVSPNDLNFGSVYLESISTDSVIVTNTGGGNLNITSVYPTNNQFSVLPANAVVAPLTSQKFAITFAPTTGGLKSGYIVFLHDGATGRDSVSVSGTGIITIAGARALPNASEVIIEGVITRGLGAFTRIQDATAGIVIRQTSGSFFDAIVSGDLRAGDKIRVTGKTSEYMSLKQINAADLLSWERLSRDNTLPPPQLVTLAEIAANGEQYESELIKVTDMIIDPAGDLNFLPAKTYSNITDPSSPTSLVVLRTPNAADSDIDGTPIPTAKCIFTGVLGQFHSTNPAAGYQLSPVLASDVTIQVNVSEPNVLPDKFSLNGNYPNPFNPATKISFDLPKSTNISLTVYNLLGQKVKDLITNKNYGAGRHEVSFDASGYSTGVYLYKLSSPEFTAVKKMILSK
ncbi:MAG: T9SS type A sorting domain-containing protein [Bacteroidota bacterium]|nr:T9SS type A sorting domain-containing protein [Bacteroidota bacterium]